MGNITPEGSEFAEVSNKALSIDVFSARGFLGGSEYERYYLKDDLLWRECGSISKKAPTQTPQALRGDTVFKSDPNLTIEQRRIERVSGEKEKELKLTAARLVKDLKEDSQSIPPPGPFFSLTEPGVFEIQISLGEDQTRIITSVDAVADKDSDTLSRTHELFATVRGVGPTICESPTFFGIARQ